MNIWTSCIITEKGLALQSKLIAGTALTITRAVTGTGYVSPDQLKQQTSVTGETQELTFRAVTYPESGKCALPCYLTNKGLAAAYMVTQVGVYADDPDEGEILYFIAQVAEGMGSAIPAEDEVPSYSAEWTFYFQYGQADNVNVTVDPAGTVTVAMLEAKVDRDLHNVTGAAFAEKAIESQADAIYTAESDDGVDYTVTVPGVTELYAGLRIHVKFGRTSASTTPTLNVNGLGAKGIRQPLSMNNAAVTSGALSTWLSDSCPVVLIYNGSQWKTEVVRPSASNIYGQVPIANGGTGASTRDAARTNLGISSVRYDTTISSWGSTMTFSHTSITATCPVEIHPGNGITLEQLKALQKAQIVWSAQTAGKLTYKCLGTVPSISIPVTFIIRGDL